MEVVDVDKILEEEGLQGDAIFYGMEEIRTRNLIIRAFAILKRLAPTFVQFHKLPAMKLHGVVTRYEL